MKRNEFGTFSGVFTPCILTILGVIMFMRANFVVGQAGVYASITILCLCSSITFLTALSTSAIGTNMQVRGGGAYFLISRVLGVERGGAIGVILFLALAASVPFYVLGFMEALVQTFPALKPHEMSITLLTAAVLFIVTYVGAGWAIRVQFVIMVVLFLSIAVFLGGAWLRFSPETFSANQFSAYTPIHADRPESGAYSFWMLFAIYFPAVTGIMAGINMSGDLKDPGRSIPRGSLAAIGVGFIIYFVQIVLGAGAYPREALVHEPYLSLKNHALFGAGWLVTAGMFAASLSSALGSFMGAPRVLQALGRDEVLPVAKPFARGSRKGDEPRRALFVAGALTLGVLTWAHFAGEGQALNLVAQLITEFFLCTYGMLNVAAFVEGVGRNPSFRPQFKYFHWSSALAGALGCIAVAFIINPAQAATAFAFLGGLVWYIKKRELDATFGDAWRGFVYRNIRNDLIRLSEIENTPKNWRPTCLVFSGNPEVRETLVNYAVWFEANRGLLFLAQVLVGRFEEYVPRRRTALERLEEFCRKRDLDAFPVVVIDEDLAHGMAGVLQATCIGPIRPNLVMFGWSDDPDWPGTRASLLGVARGLGMGLVLIRPGTNPLREGSRRIDVWWRGMANGGLMILLAHLLRSNWEWRDAEIRLLRIVPNEAGRAGTEADLRALITHARVEAEPVVLVAQRPAAEAISETSADADCVFIGFETAAPGEEQAWHQRFRQLLPVGPTTVLVCSAGEEDILA